MHNFELAKFMFKFYNKQLPKLFDEFFLKVSDSHNYSTRYAKKYCMFYPKFLKHWPKIKFHSKVLSYGEKIKNELKQMNWHNLKKIVKGHI